MLAIASILGYNLDVFRPDPLPAPALNADPRTELAQLVARRILEPARAVGIELATVGPTAIPSRQQVCWTDFEAWLFTESTEDPVARASEGKLPIPLAIHERLSTLASAGVDPDLVWLAHQLPATWLDGDPIPDLVPPPPRLQRIDQALLTPVRGMKKLAGLIAVGARELPLGVAALIEGATEGAGGLDPVVLGGVKHPTLPVVQWVTLAQWTWE